MKIVLRLTLPALLISCITGIATAQISAGSGGNASAAGSEVGVSINRNATDFATNAPIQNGASSLKQDKTADAGQQNSATTATKEEKKSVETVDVQVRPLKAYESFSGLLESSRTHEIKTDFDSWTDLVVDEVIEQGATVSPGKTILKFKTETLDKALAEAEFAFKNAQFDFQKAELDLKLASDTFEMDKAQADRTWQEAQDDYQYFLAVELPNQLDDLEYGKKSSGYSLEYSKDELDQLQKMYLEDELTEESEAIVLKRAQRDVESSERYFKRNNQRIQREETTEIPRQKIAREMTLKRAELEHRRALITLPIAKEKAEVAFNQAKLGLDDKSKKFEELRADRARMEVKATAAGVVYYGRCEKGKWSDRKLELNQKVSQDSVVMTIVDPNALSIRASLEEAKLANLAPKMSGRALVSAAGDGQLPVTINSIASISNDDGKFDCQIMIDNPTGGVKAMPGMGCKLSFLCAEREALMTKKASVFSDDDGVSHFVFVVDGDQVKRTDVVVGQSVGDDIEIVEGLTAGSKISKARQ